MTIRQVWIGSIGPFQYDDAAQYPDGEFHTGIRADKILVEGTPVLSDHAITLSSITGLTLPTATAENDFIASGATPFAWAKKTLAQVKTILGLSNRNAIINGGMDIWQRGTTFTNPLSYAYFADRFQSTFSLGDCTFDVAQSAETVAAGFPFNYSLKVDCTAVETAVAASEFLVLRYKMEGYDFKRFRGETATLSFWVKAVKTGIYCVAFRNNAADRAYVAEYTISSASTWEKKIITLTFNDDGTWLFTNGMGVNINWVIMCGSTYQIATANKNTWQTGNYFATDAQVNGLDNTANNFWLTGVQLELGSAATPFEQRPYAQELALCQRYCQTITTTETNEVIGSGMLTSDTLTAITIPLKVPMRITPTCEATAGDWIISEYYTVESVTSISVWSGYNGKGVAVLTVGVASGLTPPGPCLLCGDGTTGRVLILSAEL